MSYSTGSHQPADSGVPPQPPSPRTSWLAITSLVLAVLFFMPLVPVVGCILGVIAIIRISASKGAMKGMGLAIAGTVVGVVSTFVMVILLSALADAREMARDSTCRSNLMQIGRAISMYQTDWQDEMPPNIETLCTCAKQYLKIGVGKYEVEHNTPVGDTVLTCPSRGNTLMSADLDGTGSYYYARLKNPSKMEHPAAVPFMWEKVQAHGQQGVIVLFTDFCVQKESLEQLRAKVEQNADQYAKPPVLPEAEKE